jgi:hypothetical protein
VAESTRIITKPIADIAEEVAEEAKELRKDLTD